MLATTPLFYAYDWPRRTFNYIVCRKPRDNAARQSDTAAVTAADAVANEDADGDDNDDDVSRNTSATSTSGKVCKRQITGVILKYKIKL